MMFWKAFKNLQLFPHLQAINALGKVDNHLSTFWSFAGYLCSHVCQHVASACTLKKRFKNDLRGWVSGLVLFLNWTFVCQHISAKSHNWIETLKKFQWLILAEQFVSFITVERKMWSSPIYRKDCHRFKAEISLQRQSHLPVISSQGTECIKMPELKHPKRKAGLHVFLSLLRGHTSVQWSFDTTKIHDSSMCETADVMKAPNSVVWTGPLYMQTCLAGGPLFQIIWMSAIERQTMFHIPLLVQSSCLPLQPLQSPPSEHGIYEAMASIHVTL